MNDDFHDDFGDSFGRSPGGINYGDEYGDDDGGYIGGRGGGISSDSENRDESKDSEDSEGDGDFDSDDGKGGSPGEGEINFGETFKDKQRTAGGALKIGGGGVSGAAKSTRTAEDAATDRARGILAGEKMYDDLKSNEKESIIIKIANLENVGRYSVDILIPAFLFIIRKLNLKKDFASFFKNIKGIEAVDLVRYIRMLSLKK